MNPRRLALRVSLDQLAKDFAGDVLRALRTASIQELGELQSSTDVSRTVETPAPSPSSDVLASPPRPRTALAKLSPRERDIFQGVLQGSSSARIALDLGISVKTVETHRANVNKKLGLRSPVEVVRFGVMHGLLRPEDDQGAGVVGDLPDAPSPIFDLAEVERRTIAAALRAADGNRTRAAILLGIPRSSLYNKLGTARPPRAARAPLAAPEASPHPEELEDVDPSVAITAPDAVLGLLEPAANDAPERPAAPPAPREFRPATRPGEVILRAAGGGAVLRRRRGRADPVR